MNGHFHRRFRSEKVQIIKIQNILQNTRESTSAVVGPQVLYRVTVCDFFENFKPVVIIVLDNRTSADSAVRLWVDVVSE